MENFTVEVCPQSRARKPPSLREVLRWIGRLGGYPGRKRDGEPGVKILWRGMSRLQDLKQGAKLGARGQA